MEGFLPPSSRVPVGMVLDEIDSCIKRLYNKNRYFAPVSKLFWKLL